MMQEPRRIDKKNTNDNWRQHPGMPLEYYSRLMFYAKLAQDMPRERNPVPYSITNTANNNELTTELFATELEFKLKNTPPKEELHTERRRKHSRAMLRLRHTYRMHSTSFKIKRLRIRSSKIHRNLY